jgi:hypothetical protein
LWLPNLGPDYGLDDFDEQLRNCMYEIWDGDLFLYHVDTQHEADEADEAGFTVREIDRS